MYSVLPLVLVCALLIEINPSGIRHMEYQVGTPSPLVSQFFPAQRLTQPESGSQTVKEQPIYVTVRYPHRYDTATITVLGDNPYHIAWKVGLATGQTPGSWSYTLAEPTSSGSAAFDLAGAQVSDGRLRFIITTPTLTAGRTFVLKGVTIDLKRESLISTLIRRF